MKNRVGIIGGGPAGCICAKFLDCEPVIFDKTNPLKTLLYTGGGRCNLANAIYDFKQLAKNYPRGEKFLYSIFSRFGTSETIDFFKSIGVETYIQDDNRIFPASNSAAEVRKAILKSLKHTYITNEEVKKIIKRKNEFVINDNYIFDKVVISTGGHSGYEIAKSFGHEIIEPKPSLVGLITKEDFNLEGVSLKNVMAKIEGQKNTVQGDLVFTKRGISGPLAYIVSSLYARKEYSKTNPINILINFGVNDFTQKINENGKKDLRNIVSEYVPKSLSEYICKELGTLKGHEITKEIRKKTEDKLNNFKITVIGHEKSGEVVTSGGVSLREINPKTMESRLVEGLYFCGEVIDVDGFCGGFNLQNAWSTGYIAAMGINED